MTLRYLILALTTSCNLSCSYCYNGKPAKLADMSEPVLKQAFSLAAKDGRRFHVQLTGGEPTLVPDLICKAAEYAKNVESCISIGIQTNGTCLTKELLNIFRIYNIQVGVSLDGPPAIHQRQRAMAGKTLRGLQMLESAGIPFRITTVVTSDNTAFLDRLVLTLAGFSCARGIGLDLLVSKKSAENSSSISLPDSLSLKNGLEKMIATLDAVNARRTMPIRLRERDLLINPKTKHGKGDKRKPVFCHACKGESLAVCPDGSVYPCGQTIGDPAFAAGTVWEPDQGALKLLQRCIPDNAKCKNCMLKGVCPGDCPSRLFYNSAKSQTLACTMYSVLWRENCLN